MLILKTLNSDATLNNFDELSSIEFIPGEQITVKFQIFDTEKQLRFIPPVACITTIVLNNIDDTTTTKIAVPLPDDRSIISIELSEIETENLLGGNVSATLDLNGDDSNIRKAIGYNSFVKIIEGVC